MVFIVKSNVLFLEEIYFVFSNEVEFRSMGFDFEHSSSPPLFLLLLLLPSSIPMRFLFLSLKSMRIFNRWNQCVLKLKSMRIFYR